MVLSGTKARVLIAAPNRGSREALRSVYVSVLSLLDWHLTLAVVVMGTAVASAFFLILGIVASSARTEET